MGMTSICEHIKWSVQGQMIYKDQCTRCFVEAKSDNGIQVCLKCFNGSCIDMHSPQHNNQHNHWSSCHWSCHLSSNLWLCLYCGHVGCGRKMYDGSGGNNHAVKHSKAYQHHLVVKLETITSDGKGDYKCDDEVIDNFLKEHLDTYSIEIEKQVKTEKAIAELTLDAVLTIQLSKSIEEGQVLDFIFGPEFTGIDNIGNTCYMNSVVQVFFSIPEFKQLYSLEHQFNCTQLPVNCILCQISKVNHGLNSGEFSIKKVSKSSLDTEGVQKDFYQYGIRLYDLKYLVAKEYWQLLNPFFQKTEKYYKLQQLTSMFSYDQTTFIKCVNCGGHKVNVVKNYEFKVAVEQQTQDQIDLYYVQEKLKYEERIKSMKPEDMKPFQLNDLPEYDTTFEKCLQLLKEGERVEMFCPKCQSLQLFVKQEYFKTFPKYLFVPEIRFVQKNWVAKKLNASIKIEQFSDFNEFKEPLFQDNDTLKEQQQGQEYTEDNLQTLMGMGLGENRCKRALLKFKNDVEAAMMFIMGSLDDPTQDQPIQQKENGQQINEEFVEQIIVMGFSPQQARFALSRTDNNLERAMDYIFNHDLEQEMNHITQQQQKQDQFQNQTSKYELFACIVHLGRSYGECILYNDSKVAKITEPALNKGYIYIFRRLD